MNGILGTESMYYLHMLLNYLIDESYDHYITKIKQRIVYNNIYVKVDIPSAVAAVDHRITAAILLL